MDRFDAATMKSKIAAIMEDDFSSFYDVYLPKEYENGALDDAESIYPKFREIYENAIEPLVKLFEKQN